MGAILSDALGRIDPDSRWLVLLSDVEGFSYEELAEMAEVPVGTVKSRLHRARMALRRMLAPVV
jgi:RNA polymerase sigma-70 factor (ECF subfamily)